MNMQVSAVIPSSSLSHKLSLLSLSGNSGVKVQAEVHIANLSVSGIVSVCARAEGYFKQTLPHAVALTVGPGVDLQP